MTIRYAHSPLARAFAGVALAASIVTGSGLASAVTCPFTFPTINKTCRTYCACAVSTVTWILEACFIHWIVVVFFKVITSDHVWRQTWVFVVNTCIDNRNDHIAISFIASTLPSFFSLNFSNRPLLFQCSCIDRSCKRSDFKVWNHILNTWLRK